MSDYNTNIDPELLKLFTSSRGSNAKVSGLLGNLDNPMLSFLAGAYDPYAAQSGGVNSAWTKYANDPTPVIQEIISKINDGMDIHQINSLIDSMAQNNVDFGGFQVNDVKGVAKDLLGKTGSGGKQDMWAKAGLRNPMEVYTTSDVPINSSVQAQMTGHHALDKQLTDKSSKAYQDVLKSQEGLNPFQIAQLENRPSEAYDSKAIIQWLKNTKEGKDILKKNNIKLSNYDSTTGEYYHIKQHGLNWNPLNWVDNATSTALRVGEDIIRDNVGGKRKNISDFVNTALSPMQRYKWEKAKEAEANIKAQQAGIEKLDEASRAGVLQAYQEMGKTPTKDQLGTIMNFLSKSK